jgi:hypothetical protein
MSPKIVVFSIGRMIVRGRQGYRDYITSLAGRREVILQVTNLIQEGARVEAILTERDTTSSMVAISSLVVEVDAVQRELNGFFSDLRENLPKLSNNFALFRQGNDASTRNTDGLLALSIRPDILSRLLSVRAFTGLLWYRLRNLSTDARAKL